MCYATCAGGDPRWSASFCQAEWGKTETGRRAKFYELTVEGRKFLAAETLRWEQFSGAVAGILGEAG